MGLGMRFGFPHVAVMPWLFSPPERLTRHMKGCLRGRRSVLDEMPKEPTPFAKLKVNWAKTKVWSEGGYYARVFFNVYLR